jgi:hypothetical protein
LVYICNVVAFVNKFKKIQKMKTLKLSALFSIVLIAFSCEKKDPIIPNEEELITTLQYVLTPENGGTPIAFKFQDLDGDGGITPVISSGKLKANSNYNGQITLLNEIESPAADITMEVKAESTAHQFFYTVSDNLNLNISYLDADENDLPIGIATKIVTGSASNGTLSITLRHEPNKLAGGVSAGLIANAGGETDIEIVFNVEIE